MLPVADRCEKLKEAQEKNKRLSAIEACGDAAATLGEDLLYHRELHPASDSEDDSSDDEDDAWAEQRQLRRRFRDCPPKTLKGLVALLGEGIFSDQCGHSITFTVVSLVWLLVLFLFAIAIHLTLVFLFYPVASRMGIRPESEGGGLYELQRLVGGGGLACRPGPG